MKNSRAREIKIHRLAECPEFSAGDKTRLRELFNPHNHPGFSGRYSLAHASLEPGESSLAHRLNSHELYYILAGSGCMHVDQTSATVSPGDAIEIPPGANQWIENNSQTRLEFLCIVDPAWRPADEIVGEGQPRTDD